GLRIVIAMVHRGARRQWQREELEHLASDWILQARWNHVAGKRVLLISCCAAWYLSPSEWIIDLVIGANPQQFREIAIAHLRRRHGEIRRSPAWAPIAQVLIGPHKESLVMPVVDLGDHDWSVHRRAPAVVRKVPTWDAAAVCEEIVGHPLRPHLCVS